MIRLAPWLIAAASVFAVCARPLAAQQPSSAGADQKLNDSSPTVEQPLPYSHKTHLALGLKCQECHPNPEPGAKMAFPATTKCMACHATVAKEKPAIQELAEFSQSGQPIPWVRVYTVPDWIFWGHRTHLKAGEKCETCHGEVAQMDVMAKVAKVITMPGCIECHRQRKTRVDCSFCHDLGPAN